MDTVMELEVGPGPEPGSSVVRVLRSVGGGAPIETITLDDGPAASSLGTDESPAHEGDEPVPTG